MKELNFKSILLSTKFYLFLFFALFLAFGFQKMYLQVIINQDGWTFGEWLMNYENGGFKRRGLSGTIFFFIQDLTAIRLQIQVFYLQIILYTILIFFIIKNLWYKSISIQYFLLIFMPVTFLAYFNDPTFFGRKEIILFLIYLYFISLIINQNLTLGKEYFISVLLFIFSFFHELMLFFIPYFCMGLYLTTQKIEPKRYIKYFAAGFLPFSLFYFFGSDINSEGLWPILEERGVRRYTMESGVLNFPDQFNFSSIFAVFNTYINFYKEFSTYIIGSTIAFILFCYYIYKNTLYRKQFNFFLGLAFIYTLPLFFYAIDWGRWLNIHFTLLSFMLIILLPDSDRTKTLWENSKIINNKTEIKYLFIVPFMLSWGIYHCGNGFGLSYFVKYFYHLIFN